MLLYNEDAATFTVTAVNDAPVVGDIPNQTIAEGASFTTISLDGYVSDVDNTDAEMTWTYSGNTQLSVSITNRVATISIPSAGWSGAETITFRATDPGALYDEDPATFTVTQTIFTHSISLVAGWNLVSFNLHPVNTDIATVLSSIAGNYDVVYAWDATGAHSGSGNWMRHDTNPMTTDTLTTLDERMGFWIHMLTADTLDVMGTRPTTTAIALKDDVGGWNLVAYPSSFNGVLPDVLSNHGVGTDFSLIFAYHAAETADQWKLYNREGLPFANDLPALVPGWGYWVKVNADNNWSVEYSTP